MANNKTTYVLEIDAEVGQLKSKLETTKAALDKLGDSSFSAGVGKKITSILTQLEKLQKKASQPIDSKTTFSSLEKGFGSIVVDAKNLLGELEKISSMTTREKLSLLPEDEAKKLKEALNAVQAYTKAVEKAEKARIRSQERRKGERESTSAQLDEARETHKKAKASYDGATAKGTKYGDAKAIVAQAEAAKKAQKEIDSLEKQLKKYQKRLEELNGIENRTEEQEAELQTTRSNIRSVGGKIGARKKIVKNAPDEKTLTAANKTIEELTPTVEALELSVTQAAKEITRLENALTKLDEAIKNNSTEITSSQADYKILYEQAKKLGVSLEGVTEDVNPTNVRILTERMRDLVNEGVKPLDDAIEEVTPDIRELGDVATRTGEKISGAEEHFSSMVDNQSRIDNLKENIRQFIGWAGASKVLSAAMRNAFQDIKELDKAMTEIAVVTDFDIGDMWDQMPQYTERANELGLAITEVYEASALFYQQGLDTNEMIALSNETLKMAKIAGLDAAEATDRMTAALRGFNMELDEASAQKVADVYSELAAITASDVDEISSAMTKTASIASSAGMEFETTAAFLSQIIETTRESAETAGTAMKTVIARFQELKKSPDEIGEIDGEIVDANAIEGALRSVGVSLRDAGGQFRELDDVFLELSSKWDGLDKNTQRYIATIAAGSRQQSRFIAMMSNYARTQELVTAANNSAGASQKQYEKTMESIETKLKQLDNAWTEFSTGLLNSDLVKFAVDFLTSLLNALNRVTQGFEGFTGSLSKIGTLVAIFQTAKTIVSKFFDEIIAKIYTSAVGAGESIAQGTKDGINNKGGIKGTVGRLTGYGQIKSGVNKIQQAKNLNVDDAKAIQWRHEYNDLLVKKNKLEADGLSATKDYQKALDDIQEKEENRIYTQKEVNEISEEGFNSIIKGAQQAGQAITMLGVGLGVVGQLFAEAGNEEAAEFFQSAGNIFTFVGAAITGVASIIPAFKTIFGGLVTQMVAGGVSVQAAWWWITLIVAAVVALAIGVAAIVNAIKNASPEAKLERAQEAANKAAEAAKNAESAYENLAKSFEGLEDKYQVLEDLTRGTKEWNEAVREINNSVLELITDYPELANFVENKTGVLTIDLNSNEVQQVLKEAEAAKITTANAANLANVHVAEAENLKKRKELDNDAKVHIRSSEATAAGVAAGAGAATVGTGVGAGIGAGAGAIIAAISGGFGSILIPAFTKAGAAIGAGIGTVVGGFAGEAAAEAYDAEKEDFLTDELAKALASGETLPTEKEIVDKLIDLGVSADEAENLANNLAENADELIKYGSSLNAAEEQQKAAYSAIAASAQSLANTLGMSEEQIKQSSVLVDDDISGLFYEEEKKRLDELSNKDLANDENVQAAVEQTYGEGATIDKNGLVKYTKDGENAEVTLTREQIIAMASTKVATEKSVEAIEASDYAVDAAGGVLGEKAIGALYSASEGGALTKEDKDTLSEALGEGFTEKWSQMSDEEKKSAKAPEKIQQAWDAMGPEGQKAFGGDITKFIDDITEGVEIATTAFADAEEQIGSIGGEIKDFMTADMAKGFTSKMEEVWKVSGKEGVKQIQNAYNTLLAGKSDEVAQEITARMNALDWGNAEQLLAFEIELEEQYSYSRQEAQAMTKAMAKGAKATSNLTTTVEVFGKFYHATEKLNAALEKTADLQWEYERMLKKGASATALAANLEKQRQSILKSGNEALAAYDAAREDQATTYAKGVNLPGVGKDVTQYVKFDENTGTYDLTELQRQINAGEFGAEGSESRQAVEDYISELKEANELANDQLDAAKEAYEQLEELNEQAEDAYWSLYDQIGELIVTELEKEISIQQDILDATQSANEKLINKIQEQIDDERQARENEKAEESISDLYNQAAYLGMDTSGANSLAVLDLEKQIAEEEEAYQDSLIDQSIQNLQDANEKAAEQRERQIFLAESQLELYKNSTEFQNAISQQLNEFMGQVAAGVDVEDTYIGQRLLTAGFTKGMNPDAEKGFWEALTADIGAALPYWKGDLNDTTDMYALLSAIQANTAATNLADIGLQQEYKGANAYANNVSNTLGFSFDSEKKGVGYKTDAQGNVTDEIDYSHENTQDYISDMGAINTIVGSQGSSITDTRNTAQTRYELMTSDGMSNWATSGTINGLKTEGQYYNEMSAEDMGTLRDDIATGNLETERLWANKINSEFTDFQSNWDKYLDGQLSDLANKNKRDGFEGIIDNMSTNGLSGLISNYAKVHELEDATQAKNTVIGKLKWYTEKYTEGSINGDGDDGFSKNESNWNNADQNGKKDFWGNVKSITTTGDMKWKLDGKEYNVEWRFSGTKTKDSFKHFLGEDPGDKWVVMSDDNLWAYNAKMQQWLPLKQSSEDGAAFYTDYSRKLKSGREGFQYKTGGLADYTGPAWLDGTPQRPEYVLNAAQTERFFSLIDVLEGFDSKEKKKTAGDNYFDIEINVEKIEDDYDVEQMANKIRSMIYEDATYRNVNAINHIR